MTSECEWVRNCAGRVYRTFPRYRAWCSTDAGAGATLALRSTNSHKNPFYLYYIAVEKTLLRCRQLVMGPRRW